MKIIRVKTKDALSEEQLEKREEEFDKVFGSPRFLRGCTGYGPRFYEFEYSDINPTVRMLKDGSIEVEWENEDYDWVKKKFTPNVSCRQVANFLKKEEAKVQ